MKTIHLYGPKGEYEGSALVQDDPRFVHVKPDKLYERETETVYGRALIPTVQPQLGDPVPR